MAKYRKRNKLNTQSALTKLKNNLCSQTPVAQTYIELHASPCTYITLLAAVKITVRVSFVFSSVGVFLVLFCIVLVVYTAPIHGRNGPGVWDYRLAFRRRQPSLVSATLS